MSYYIDTDTTYATASISMLCECTADLRDDLMDLMKAAMKAAFENRDDREVEGLSVDLVRESVFGTGMDRFTAEVIWVADSDDRFCIRNDKKAALKITQDQALGMASDMIGYAIDQWEADDEFRRKEEEERRKWGYDE